jgi:lysophospholipase L1-like esterase
MAGTVSALATVLFAGGFVYAARSILDPASAAGMRIELPQQQTEAPEQAVAGSLASKPKINIVALGDSLTAGTGDVTGKGYVLRVKDKLSEQWTKPVYVLNNLAIPGYRTGQLEQQLETKPVLDAVRQADIILLTIGGNDLNEGVNSSDASQGDMIDFQKAKANLPGAAERFDAILNKLSETNPNALIVYSALYYPYLDLDAQRQGPPIVQAFNKAASDSANKYGNVIVVPTYDLFALGGTKYLYADHFHPNADGYERIADRIAQVLK